MTGVSLSVQSNLDKELVELNLKKVLFLVSQKMQEIAVRRAPVDTGRLKNSIQLFPKVPGATRYTVSDGVKYGIHQEYGTLKMSAQPFMRPALIEAKDVWVPVYTRQVFLGKKEA